MSDILAIDDWPDNAALIADVARLGYITGRVLDLTYGLGGFWTRYRPDDLTTNDIDREREADHHRDATRTGWADGEFETVIFDPPYKLAGTPASAEMDGRYGTGRTRTRAELTTLLLDGTAEAARLSSRWLLVKCMDQVNGGKIRWQTDLVTERAAACAFDKVDCFMLRGGRPQPGGRRQEHARRNYSTLLVFERTKRTRAIDDAKRPITPEEIAVEIRGFHENMKTPA